MTNQFESYRGIYKEGSSMFNNDHNDDQKFSDIGFLTKKKERKKRNEEKEKIPYTATMYVRKVRVRLKRVVGSR